MDVGKCGRAGRMIWIGFSIYLLKVVVVVEESEGARTTIHSKGKILMKK